MNPEWKVSRSPTVEGSVYKLDISTLAKAEAKEREHSNYPHSRNTKKKPFKKWNDFFLTMVSQEKHQILIHIFGDCASENQAFLKLVVDTQVLNILEETFLSKGFQLKERIFE